MQYGFILPMGDARTTSELACQAEESGWDGFFVPEAVWDNDARVCLSGSRGDLVDGSLVRAAA